MAKRRAKRKKALTKTQKLRRNVQATIRRAEKKGIRFSDSFKALISTAKYQTLHSLQRNKYAKLYAQGTALSPTGEVISGTQARVILRREAAKRAAETRRINKLLKDTTSEGASEPYHEKEKFNNEKGFEEQERKRREFFEKQKSNKQFQEDLKIGNIAYQNVRDIIKEFENTGAGNFGKYFTAMLDYYMDKYPEDVIKASIVAIGFEEFEDKARDVLFYNGDIENLTKAYDVLNSLINRAITYAGYTPDFQWHTSKDEMILRDSDAFSNEETRPY